jgi:muramoyltetrapeptide carboxypeptidase
MAPLRDKSILGRLPGPRYGPPVIFPPALKPGDRVGVFAGSSPFDATLVLRGLGWLAERYRVVFDRRMFERHGYLAGDDERRRDELSRLLADRSLGAIVAARGGYGLARFAHGLDWSLLQETPRWLAGFSDVTALHVEATRAGVASVHGPMVASLGRADAWTRGQFLEAMEHPLAPRRLEGLTCVRPGTAAGTLAGGNLSIVHASAAAGRLQLPAGCLLLLEDITERPYRVDRMLTTLLLGGHLASVTGVILGEWTECTPGPDRTTIEEVLAERLGQLGVPIVASAAVGHGRWNTPVVLGRRWKIDAGERTARTID